MTERILYVDDNPDSGRMCLEDTGLSYREKQPWDVANNGAAYQALDGIRIVLMDYRLHEDTSESDAPIDGLELIERFRATIRRRSRKHEPVPLLAIYTALCNELAVQLGDCPSAPYMLSRRANVDWVFEKGCSEESNDSFRRQLQGILNAFDLDVSDCDGDPQKQLCKFLRLPPSEDWSELALEQLIDSNPPMHDLSHDGVRAKLMRWLLQVALPFPGFFLGIESVAVRLNMSPDWLRSALDRHIDSEMDRLLDGCRYQGALADFYPTRYWKAGIDHILWQATRGRSMASTEVREHMERMIGEDVSLLPEPNPVLVVSPETFELKGQIADLSEAVQIQPDVWPPEIEHPWVRIDDLQKDETLRAMVISRDRDRLPERKD